MTTPTKPVSVFRKVAAAVLDFLTIFVGGGFAIAAFTGDTTAGGFSLEGTPAVLLFALVAAYFVVLPRMGGTLWQRILRTRPA